ncbi:MAG: urease accessory protein [Methylophagaceae bacterium]|jgi:urease accessory protein
MINLTNKIKTQVKEQATLTLPLSSRVKSRLRAVLDDGRDVGLFLERGQVLKNGDILTGDDGVIVKIIAAKETVSSVVCEDVLLMARACYHLGNRHVALQINPGRLQYLHDHVLDDMLRRLGLTVNSVEATFEPESGAYEGDGTHHHEH